MKKAFFLLSFFILVISLTQAQQEKPFLKIQKAEGKIVLDGVLNEPDWEKANVTSDFYQNFPADTSIALSKTEVKVTYDDNFLYISAVCHNESGKDYIVQSLKRDFSYPLNDLFAIYLDPFDDGINGFTFVVNPYGVQREGLLQNGGAFGASTEWDNLWFSEVKKEKFVWVAEIAIPFRTIRFKEGITKWGINFSRQDLKRNENSVWSPVPRNFNASALAFTGSLLWDKSPKKVGANIAIIPSVNGRFSRDYQAGETGEETVSKTSYNGSLDAKIAVTSSLNLDLTVNPDFSQVEVDRQQTNLTRFSLFFPERRNFFIENSDLFAQFGFRQIRPFFSRRIGLANGNTVPIIGGARLSGKINKNWRIGIMDMQTEGDTISKIAPQNYAVAAFQRQIMGRSSIKGIFVNRQGFSSESPDYNDYNRVAGMDFNLASNDNKWRGNIFYHTSFSPNQKTNSVANASWLMYNSRNLFWMWNHEYVSKNYDAEVGFVPRNKLYNPLIDSVVTRTYWRLEPEIKLTQYPKKFGLNSVSEGVYLDYYLNAAYQKTDYNLRPYVELAFNNTSELSIAFEEVFTKLIYPTDVTFDGNPSIPEGDYFYRRGNLSYNSNTRRKLQLNLSSNYGTFYNGSKLSYFAEVTYRAQPWGIFALSYQQNDIQLPQPYQDAYITLLGARSELSFTKSLFLTTFLQYNTQIDNVNINTRLQWRFRPMSDLYIVYTDNYDSLLKAKNQALVVKFVYWLTI